jgi:hypothetical protein
MDLIAVTAIVLVTLAAMALGPMGQRKELQQVGLDGGELPSTPRIRRASEPGLTSPGES